MRLGPLLLEPRLDSRLWGGDRLGSWMGLSSPPPSLAEAWLVYDLNKVGSGPLAGTTLAKLAVEQGEALVGRRSFARSGAEFPLLAKLIDARDSLSVQVHPDDRMARKLAPASGFGGKTEAWHILEGTPGSDVFLGFSRPVDREGVHQAAVDGSLPGLLRRLAVTAGDTLLVRAGTVHAINGGLLLFEIQQRSDLTYRLFDYGRLGPDGAPRPLHLEQALQVANLAAAPGLEVRKPGSAPHATTLVSCEFFELESWALTGPVNASTSPETFEILTAIEGRVSLGYPGGEVELARGQAAVLPAALGDYSLFPQGPARLLRAFVP